MTVNPEDGALLVCTLVSLINIAPTFIYFEKKFTLYRLIRDPYVYFLPSSSGQIYKISRKFMDIFAI